MKTHIVKPVDFKKKWVIVDAAGQTLGRLASQVALVLRGKHRPIFTPYMDTGDAVIVINAAKIKMTGNKLDDKMYHHHTGYMGGIKSITARDLLAKSPEKLVGGAIRGMLPKNKLGREIATHLRVYPDANHGQEAQKPEPMAVRTAGK